MISSNATSLASMATAMIALLSLPPMQVNAFSGMPSSPTIRISNPRNNLFLHQSFSETTIDEETCFTSESTFPSLRDHQKLLQKVASTLRLSAFLFVSAPIIAPCFVVEPAFAVSPATETQGISAVTQSTLGTSVRSTVVQSAKLVDSVDLKWERFSDSLRDNKKCDPLTNRRLFDNGFRRDGTPRGNPVLGALCDPVPLKTVDEYLIDGVLGKSLADAAYEVIAVSYTHLRAHET